jgi:hypothetical protein
MQSCGLRSAAGFVPGAHRFVLKMPIKSIKTVDTYIVASVALSAVDVSAPVLTGPLI